MRRSLAPLLLSAVLVAGCASDAETPETAQRPVVSAAPTAAPSQQPSAAPAPDIEGLVLEAEPLSRDHREGAITYDRLPPVGGSHHPRWLACDVYDAQVPDEVAVHSLEHGAVWFAHDPDLAQDDVERLAALAATDREYVLVSPLAGLDSRIVAVAWGASLGASSADDPRLEQFLEAYAGGGQGGEPGAPCRGSGLTLREARGLFGTSA
jgi:hypothetical protein